MQSSGGGPAAGGEALKIKLFTKLLIKLGSLRIKGFAQWGVFCHGNAMAWPWHCHGNAMAMP